MTYNEYIEDSAAHPERKYLLTEGPDSSTLYIPIIAGIRNPYANGLDGPARKRSRKARQQLKKKVSPHEKPYAWRLGYHCCTGQYTGGADVPSLSGSSLNRKKKDLPSIVKQPAGPPEHSMSKRSKGKIRDKATAFFRSLGKEDRIFVTLTFIQHVEDREGTRILNKFFTVVRKEIPGFEYLYVAEHQKERKEGTIHFHLLSNKRLPIQRFNNLWVLQQYNAGLTGHSKTCGCKTRCSCEKWGPEISKREILARYKEGTVQQVLNPVDVERAYSISAISWYLTKYVTKQTTGEKFGCLTWHCSRRVSKLFTSEATGRSTFSFLLTFRNYKVDRDTGECWAPQTINGQFYRVVFVNNKPAVLERLKLLETVNRWIIDHWEPDKLTYFDVETYRKLFESRGDPPDGNTFTKKSPHHGKAKIAFSGRHLEAQDCQPG